MRARLCVSTHIDLSIIIIMITIKAPRITVFDLCCCVFIDIQFWF